MNEELKAKAERAREARFGDSRICKSTHDLVVYDRIVKSQVRDAIEILVCDVDDDAGYMLCTVLLNVIKAKRDEIEERAEARARRKA